MDALPQQLRFAVRSLRSRPLFAAAAVLSLTLGIGANTAIFSVVNALLLRPVPGVGEPERVVEIGRGERGRGFDTFAYPDFLDLRASSGPLEELAAYDRASLAVSRGGAGERVLGAFVSAGYFDVMGVRPHQGRFFRPEEDRGPGQQPVAVVSQGFWRNRLGADPDVVGSSIRINRRPFTVVGVAPAEFRGHMAGAHPRVWIPIVQMTALGTEPETFRNRGSMWHNVVGRLAPGRTLEEARAHVRTVFGRLAEDHPETNAGRTGHVQPLGPVPAAGRDPVSAFLGLLSGFGGLILLITCANVAGMLLARGTAREREIAVRMSLGAGRRRVAGQLLTEALLLFGLGGGGGTLLAAWALGALPLDALPLPVPAELDLSLDHRVLAFTLLAALGTGAVFGLLPALRTTKLDVVPSLRGDGGGSAGPRRSGLRRAFVVGQVGLSLALLAGAGLFLRSLQEASRVETGFDPTGTWTTEIDLGLEGIEDPDEGRALLASLLDRLRSRSWVEEAGLASDLPLDMGRSSTAVYPADGAVSEEAERAVDYQVVSPGYLEALRVPFLRGRELRATDRDGTEPVALVSRTFVREVWDGDDALGRRFRFGSPEGPMVTVVGVVEDVKNQLLTETARPFVYVPLLQRYREAVHVVVRASRPPEVVPGELRRAILDVDPALTMSPVVSLERYTRLGILPQRLAAWVTGALGLLALLLSALGVYGVVAFSVGQRTREFGIRRALGARAGEIVRLVVRGGLRLALPGLAAGALLAVAAGRLLQGFILGVSPLDPVALGGTAAALLGVVVVAAAIPGLRASRAEPLDALRHE